jgi:hypothetical protein
MKSVFCPRISRMGANLNRSRDRYGTSVFAFFRVIRGHVCFRERMVKFAVAALLSKNSLHNFTMHIRQPILSALIAVGEPRVVDAAQMQHCGLHVVDMNGV